MKKLLGLLIVLGVAGCTNPIAQRVQQCQTQCSDVSSAVTACKTDCKTLASSQDRKACTAECNNFPAECQTLCVASSTQATQFTYTPTSNPADNYTSAEDEEDDEEDKEKEKEDEEEKKKELSDTCGDTDQECCDDDKYDDCREGLIKGVSKASGGGTTCTCYTGCKNDFSESNDGSDDCNNAHICTALPNASKANPPLVCLASECSATDASQCGFPLDKCLTPVSPSKTNVGFCFFTCIPYDTGAFACDVNEFCTPYGVSQGGQAIPVNFCTQRASTTVALGAECTLAQITNTNKITDNCEAGTRCVALAGDAKATCRKECANTSGQQPAPDASACASVTNTECASIGAVSEVQGAVFLCVPKAPTP